MRNAIRSALALVVTATALLGPVPQAPAQGFTFPGETPAFTCRYRDSDGPGTLTVSPDSAPGPIDSGGGGGGMTLGPGGTNPGGSTPPGGGGSAAAQPILVTLEQNGFVYSGTGTANVGTNYYKLRFTLVDDNGVAWLFTGMIQRGSKLGSGVYTAPGQQVRWWKAEGP